MNYSSTKKKIRTGYYRTCPRCEWHSFEHLSTHKHCTNCLYFEANHEDSGLSEIAFGEQLLKKLEKRNEKSKPAKTRPPALNPTKLNLEQNKNDRTKNKHVDTKEVFDSVQKNQRRMEQRRKDSPTN